jgi:hypothetical protein
MIEIDTELLEAYLDGELPPGDLALLRTRLAAEPELAAQLQQLSLERSLRSSLFERFEADADDAAGRVLTGFHARIQRRQRLAWIGRAMRISGAAAACLAIGFLAGWLGRSGPAAPGRPASINGHAQVTYDVAVTDESGRVMGIQKFTSFDEAREFREDLQRWQQRQEQLRTGQVTVRSAQF